jgi:endonuclease YncB( thermonuclease family)
MTQIITLKPRRRLGVRFLILFAILGVLLGGWFTSLGRLSLNNPNSAPSIKPVQIEVIDGDTIRANGQIYRLVGFDAPESGLEAKCESERRLAERATSRLRQVVAGARLRFERVPCACPPRAEGTQRCNHGRLCAVLTSAGRDVGGLLIAEGLARPYVAAPHGVLSDKAGAENASFISISHDHTPDGTARRFDAHDSLGAHVLRAGNVRPWH